MKKTILKILMQKTTWAGVSAVAAGAFMVLQKNYDAGIQTIIMGLGLIFAREAINKVTGPVK